MDEAKQLAKAAGRTITDLSIGTSDLSPPPEALETLKVRWRASLTFESLDVLANEV
jgi:aspartate/methionine/tyrosine aminotransferase